MGEVLSAIPLIKQLRRDQPDTPVYLSVSTVAGRRVAERDADSLVNGLFYLPMDFASCLRRAIRTVRPALFIVLETEIWPNLYVEIKRAGSSLAIVNGRISDHTWKRYRSLKFFFGPILQLADIVFVQSRVDYERYRELGVMEASLLIEANLKYDAAIPDTKCEIDTFGAEQVWIAASTVGPNERGSLEKHNVDEDDLVVDVFRELASGFPTLLLILAPRQPARFSTVAEKLQRLSIRFVRRTHAHGATEQSLSLPGILLLDTLGELSSAYACADVVFVGGSIAPRGGHNIVEPAANGTPIIVGPHMENFRAITEDFQNADAILQISSASELAGAVRSLLLDRARAQQLGNNARRLVETRRGVAQRLTPVLLDLYLKGHHKHPRNRCAYMFLSLLAWLWEKGGDRRRKAGELYASSTPPLGVPVISIGGITIGGSGKTPLAAYLAAQLERRGYNPAILTRGYRRRSPAKNLVLARSARVPTSLTGDEAQIFLRAGAAPIGIGANRYQTARVLLDAYPSTDVFLLDDGFQHAPLRRDVDVVVVDGLDPFGGGELVPLGRLREPLPSLKRAGVFVVTRAESDSRFHSISERLRRHNPTAPIFRTRLLARKWRDYQTGEQMDVERKRVAAFCGLGNPQNFWDTLHSLGLEVVFRWAFDDHHDYRPTELHYFSRQAALHGAELLVTTEKDRMNLPAGLQTAIAPLTLAWLEIELELQDSAGFFSFLEMALRRRSAA